MNELSFLILVLVTIAFVLQIDFIWYIIYLCLGIYAWSHWITPRSIKNITLKRIYQDHAFLGESITVTIVVRNQSRLPLPWLQLTESVPVELRKGKVTGQTIRLSGHQTKSLAYEIQALRRGYYRLGPSFITAGDLFGFKENQARLDPDFLTVYPRIIPLSTLGLPSKLPIGTIRSNQRLYEDPARPIGIRAYQLGDSQRHINWKVSAHANVLLVKTYEPAISLETFILLNLNQAEYSHRFRHDGPEWAIVVAASLAAYLEGQRQAVGLGTNGADPLIYRDRLALQFDEVSGRLLMSSNSGDVPGTISAAGASARFIPHPIPPRPGRGHLMKLLEQLARIEGAHTLSFWSWIPQACLHLSWGVTLLVISPTGDNQTCQALHRLHRVGYNPVLIVVEPYVNFRLVQQRSHTLGFPAFHVSDQRALQTFSRPLHGRL